MIQIIFVILCIKCGIQKKIEFKNVNNLLKNEELRILILREIKQYRNERIFLLDKISYDNLAKLFKIIINNS